MKSYIAKGPHKRPCDLCGRPVLVGDAVDSWPVVGEDGPESSNIMRVHKTCRAIMNREGLCEFMLGHAFETRGEYDGEWTPTPIKAEADAALEADRLSRPTSSLEEVIRRIAEAGSKIPDGQTTRIGGFNGVNVSAVEAALHVLVTINSASRGDPFSWMVRT